MQEDQQRVTQTRPWVTLGAHSMEEGLQVRSAHTLPAVVCVCVCIEKCACESCSDSLQDVPKILILASLTRLRDLLWPQV